MNSSLIHKIKSQIAYLYHRFQISHIHNSFSRLMYFVQSHYRKWSPWGQEGNNICSPSLSAASSWFSIPCFCLFNHFRALYISLLYVSLRIYAACCVVFANAFPLFTCKTTFSYWEWRSLHQSNNFIEMICWVLNFILTQICYILSIIKALVSNNL